jgi:voltage-gated potassium channel
MNRQLRTNVLMYFAFTTLSTVGFGDYYPVSNIERLVGSFVMLFGVAIFSYCAGELLVMVDTLLEISDD